MLYGISIFARYNCDWGTEAQEKAQRKPKSELGFFLDSSREMRNYSLVMKMPYVLSDSLTSFLSSGS